MMKTEKSISLISKAKSGDIAAFEELISSSEKLVYNIALRMLYDAEDAKDISQEVFIKIYKNLNRFDGKSSFSTWVYRIAVNTCIDQIRKKKSRPVVSDTGFALEEAQSKPEDISYDDPESSYINKEVKTEIKNAMESLSEEHRAMIVLRDIEGFSYDEISEISNLSLGTVKSRISRAREQLKTVIVKNRELLRSRDRQIV